ncbi:tol-pal system protein [Brevundimonas sp.]|jgi:TolA-binding protein|uniref:tetratricopeptide repeat protein n=1 Tax=Brevundimonas sp. TaxID=1871086 RepID=UPI002E0D9337|nr:tol-pal system protein [Brevundimonas sp.]
MLKLPKLSRNALMTALGVSLIAGTVIAQVAPTEPIIWDKRRLDQLDRNVRKLERAIFQRNADGQPFLMEPDPEVVALQGRVGGVDRRLADVEATIQRMNGDIESLTLDLEQMKTENGRLRTRLGEAEARVGSLEQRAREEAELNAPIVANSPTGAAAGDLAAANRLLSTNPARGERALEVVIVTWPDAEEARLANVRLGDLRVEDQDTAGAVPYYAAALRGWPTAGWAPEATIKLAEALEAEDQSTDACIALREFRTRYGTGAPQSLTTRATAVRTSAGCR